MNSKLGEEKKYMIHYIYMCFLYLQLESWIDPIIIENIPFTENAEINIQHTNLYQKIIELYAKTFCPGFN